jgi:hypothetical protein
VNRVNRILPLALAVLICLGMLGAAQGCSTPTTPGAPQPTAGNGPAELRDAAVDVAERTAVALVSLDHRDPEAGYDRLLDLLANPARQEWEQRRAEYLAPLVSDAVTATDVARTSGVAEFDPAARTATVLVAATATVTTDQAPAGDDRRYRLRMSLVDTPAGWKVSELRFVA